MAAQVSLCPDMLTKYIHYKQIKSKKGLEKDSLGHWTKNKEFLLTDCAAGHFPQISLSSQTCCPGNYNTCYDIHPTAAKKRNTANKKERRRTKSINSAFSLLRTKIPNVPIDTKLSKIKTLKLAILYIKYLLESLDGSQDLKNGIRFEMVPLMLGTQSDRKCCDKKSFIVKERIVYDKGQGRNKGRTGWPQEVWESELNPEENKVITHKKNQCVT